MMEKRLLTKRSAIEIVYEILRLNGKKKTEIMYGTALTYPQTIRYLGILTERGLLAKALDPNGREVYRVTPKGQETSHHLQAIILALGLEAEYA